MVFVCAAHISLDFENIQNISIIARINVGIIFVFILLDALIIREHRKRSSGQDKWVAVELTEVVKKAKL